MDILDLCCRYWIDQEQCSSWIQNCCSSGQSLNWGCMRNVGNIQGPAESAFAEGRQIIEDGYVNNSTLTMIQLTRKVRCRMSTIGLCSAAGIRRGVTQVGKDQDKICTSWLLFILSCIRRVLVVGSSSKYWNVQKVWLDLCYGSTWYKFLTAQIICAP